MSGVSIVIPTWNGLELLKKFLPSVLRAADNYCQQEARPAEILIVDDGSTDGTSHWLTSQGFHEVQTGVESTSSTTLAPAQESNDAGIETDQINLSFVRNPVNSGFAASCNTGVRMARYPLIFLLNNDVEPAADSISLLGSNFSEPSTFAAHCRVLTFDGGKEVGTGKLCSFKHGFLRVHRSYLPRPDSGGRSGQYGRRMEDEIPLKLYSAFAGGGASMFDRDKFVDLGGFEELLSPYYWEDVELSYRAWKRGYTVLYEPRAVARHRISSTIGKLPEAGVKRIQQRNRIILHWINLHDRRLMRWHLLWLLLLTLTAPIRLQSGFIPSVLSAFGKLKEIRKRRAKEQFLARRTDRAVISIFDQFLRDQRIIPYDRSLHRASPSPRRRD